MQKLKNCPCCGGAAEIRTRMHYGGEAWIECKICGLRTKDVKADGVGESEKLAKKIWERRTI